MDETVIKASLKLRYLIDNRYGSLKPKYPLYLGFPQAFSRPRFVQAQQFHEHSPSEPAAERPPRLWPFKVEAGGAL